MSAVVSAEEIAGVNAAPLAEQFEYFAKKVADVGEAWGLYQEGRLLLGDDDGNKLFPLCPANGFAEACRAQNEAFVATAIPVEDLLGVLMPELAEENVLACVSYKAGGQGVVLPWDELRAAIDYELSRV